MAQPARRASLILAAVIVLAMAFNLWATRGQTLFSDEWGRLVLAGKDSLRSLLLGYSGHLTVLHAALYRAVFGIFGADTYVPLRILEALLLGVNGVLFYALARTRTTPGLAVIATMPLLFLGSADEVTATPFGLVVLLPIAFGLASLVCVTRLGRAGDPLTCVLLLLAIASLSDGLAFLAAVGAALVVQSGRGALRRSWVIVAPALLYLAWYVWAHHNGAPSPAEADNVQQLPAVALDSAAAGIAAVTGFFGGIVQSTRGRVDLEAGYLLLGLALVALGFLWSRGKRAAPEIWIPIAGALAFWALLGLVVGPDRPVGSSRYLYPSAVFVLLIVVELTRGVRLRGDAAVLIVAGIMAVAVIPNAVALNHQASNRRKAAKLERTSLTAVELLHRDLPGSPPPDLALTDGFIGIGRPPAISGSGYLAAVEKFGSPAYSPAEVAELGGGVAATVDALLLAHGDIAVAPARLPGSHCVGVVGVIPLTSRGVIVRPEPLQPMTITARRFSSSFQPVQIPSGGGGNGSVLVRSNAAADPPWVIQVSGGRVCKP